MGMVRERPPLKAVTRQQPVETITD
jgi:hypothetical protein